MCSHFWNIPNASANCSHTLWEYFAASWSLPSAKANKHRRCSADFHIHSRSTCLVDCMLMGHKAVCGSEFYPKTCVPITAASSRFWHDIPSLVLPLMLLLEPCLTNHMPLLIELLRLRWEYFGNVFTCFSATFGQCGVVAYFWNALPVPFLRQVHLIWAPTGPPR